MLSHQASNRSIGYHGKRIMVLARRFKWGDLVPIEDKFEDLRAGDILRRNRQMGEDSGGASEYMRYHGLYDIWRAGQHIEHRYQGEEMVQLDGFEDRARMYARLLVSMKHILPEDRERIVAGFVAMAKDLHLRKRAARKVVAGTRFEEATPEALGPDLRDSLGRRNPVAAAMRVGAGIGHIDARFEDIAGIMARTDLRTIEVYAAIQKHMLTYWELWLALRPKPVSLPTKKRALVSLYLPRSALEMQPVNLRAYAARGDMGSLATVANLLEQMRNELLLIDERPFRNNAKHACDDIHRIIQECINGRTLDLDEMFGWVNNGISWVFAQHVLQIGFIARLSLLIHRLEREMHLETAENGMANPTPIKCDMAPQEFSELEKTWADFIRRLHKCSDAGLGRQLKSRALAQSAMIQGLIEADAWEEAKKRALLLSQIF